MTLLRTILTSAIGACLAFSANAVTLNTGGVVFTSGVKIANDAEDPVSRPYLAGGVLHDEIIDFSYDPTPSTPLNNIGGEIQNRVIRNADGDLIFMPRFRNLYNIDGGTFALTAVQYRGFSGVSTDVDFRLDGLGDKGFTSVSRSVDGDLMTMRFAEPILADSINPPGRREESYFPALVTDASDYDFSGTMRIFGEIIPLGSSTPSGLVSNTFTIDVFGLVAPDLSGSNPPAVPIPASVIMLLSALGFLGIGFGRKAA